MSARGFEEAWVSLERLKELFADGFKYEMASFFAGRGPSDRGPDTGEESYSQVKARKIAARKATRCWWKSAIEQASRVPACGQPGVRVAAEEPFMRMLSLIILKDLTYLILHRLERDMYRRFIGVEHPVVKLRESELG